MKRLAILLTAPCSLRIRRWLGALCKGATAALRIAVLLRPGPVRCVHQSQGATAVRAPSQWDRLSRWIRVRVSSLPGCGCCCRGGGGWSGSGEYCTTIIPTTVYAAHRISRRLTNQSMKLLRALRQRKLAAACRSSC